MLLELVGGTVGQRVLRAPSEHHSAPAVAEVSEPKKRTFLGNSAYK